MVQMERKGWDHPEVSGSSTRSLTENKMARCGMCLGVKTTEFYSFCFWLLFFCSPLNVGTLSTFLNFSVTYTNSKSNFHKQKQNTRR